MTVERCLERLDLFKRRIENPEGQDAVERAECKKMAKLAYEDMIKHIKKAKKFKGHPILAELEPKESKDVQRPKQKKKEEKAEE